MREANDLLAGRYRFDLLDRITLADGSDIDLWSSRDALVLKALTIVLPDADHCQISLVSLGRRSRKRTRSNLAQYTVCWPR